MYLDLSENSVSMCIPKIWWLIIIAKSPHFSDTTNLGALVTALPRRSGASSSGSASISSLTASWISSDTSWHVMLGSHLVGTWRLFKYVMAGSIWRNTNLIFSGRQDSQGVVRGYENEWYQWLLISHHGDDSVCVEDQWLPCKLGIKSDQTWLVSDFNSSISRGPSLAASTHR